MYCINAIILEFGVVDSNLVGSPRSYCHCIEAFNAVSCSIKSIDNAYRRLVQSNDWSTPKMKQKYFHSHILCDIQYDPLALTSLNLSTIKCDNLPKVSNGFFLLPKFS